MPQEIARRRRRSVAWLCALVLLIAAFSYTTWTIHQSARHITRLEDAGGRQSQTIDSLYSGLTTTEKQLRENHISPSAAPPASILKEATGASTPSSVQVQEYVDAYLAAHPPTASVPLAAVEAEVNAYFATHPVTASQAQIAAAVATYMAIHPAPSGAPGSPGTQGSQGEQGSPGQQGSPGTPGSPGPACPDGYTQTAVPDPSGSGDTWMVCASPAASSSPTSPSTAPSSPPATQSTKTDDVAFDASRGRSPKPSQGSTGTPTGTDRTQTPAPGPEGQNDTTLLLGTLATLFRRM